jgi:hypothetical protein
MLLFHLEAGILSRPLESNQKRDNPTASAAGAGFEPARPFGLHR